MTNRIVTIVGVICVNFILTSCLNMSSRHDGEIGVNSLSVSEISTPETDNSIPRGWILYPKPKTGGSEIQCANVSIDNEWKVENISGRLRISKYFYQPDEQVSELPTGVQAVIHKNAKMHKALIGYKHAKQLENGWLIGSDAGEWGGKLFWFSDDGTQTIELLSENVRGIVNIDDTAFILTGLAHLGIDNGAIHKLIRDDTGNLRTQLIVDLKTQPQAFELEDAGTILITVDNGILRFGKAGELDVLKATSFETLYPNSIAATSSGVIYVGMRLFIMRLLPTSDGYREEWLIPEHCQKFAIKDFDCVCQS